MPKITPVINPAIIPFVKIFKIADQSEKSTSNKSRTIINTAIKMLNEKAFLK